MAFNIDLNNSFGALYIGATIGAIFFGLSNVQAFLYFQAHRDEGITFYKIAVCWLCFLDALHVALVNHIIYYYLIVNYANPLALPEIVWSFKVMMIIDTLIVYTVHLLYLQRIWILSKGRTRILPAVMAVAIVLLRAIFKCHLFSELDSIRWTVYLGLGAVTLIDILIATSLCHLLATAKTGDTSDARERHYQYRMLDKCVIDGVHNHRRSNAKQPHLPCNRVATVQMYALLAPYCTQKAYSTPLVYVNSYMALLNARYYHDGSAHTSQARPPQVYRPELQVKVSQDVFPRISTSDKLQVPDKAREHPTYYTPVGAGCAHPIEVVTESFSKLYQCTGISRG
ncbi:uncharacterized protein EDB91DRAFT_1258529 [Suillus paluster]|uniref:uncharacterized protein n=1 Tax=Suillus paluster TaxID=48578 RepID=UPI001B8796B5|nr:uncharacterized protein EDB91DRAFT_1258529 [Suillus paluster]KAG1718485.1 hypothetical protein EDB91DRAFT_1258529 [Suillus paluster]